ncbi:WD40/YVTN/BNR-like repeat-containing protein [Bacillus sp. B-jedd]|uniref:WD40/YVTN/BNR-like repeat-containing protein n=1 Tax=Bacillus sp. B-jedd TaxID=1476857 RepID=UPI0005155431|nr:sialidase family protein [Bacillus sp. B-jedd]CEG25455.1 glycosyl hydrolase family protein [Bacillus sp. B-jedd]
MKKTKSFLLLLPAICIILFAVIQLFIGDKEKPEPKPAKVGKVELDSKLPYKVQVGADEKKPEIIAYRLWFDLMTELEKEGAIAGKTYTRFTKLSGDENSFVAAVVFDIHLPEDGARKVDYGLGEVKENGDIPTIVWKMTINKADGQAYTLAKIERIADTRIGLPPVESLEDYHEKTGIKASEGVKYEIKDGVLMVTYDNGQKWVEIPVRPEDLAVDANGRRPEQELIGGTYVISPKKTAFLLNGLRVLISNDKGETWDTVTVSDQGPPGERFKKLGFTSDEDGYLIITGDKTMSWEAHFIFKTNDGGKTWHSAKPVENESKLVTDGGFVTDRLGFLSFGELRYEGQPPVPNLYRTSDGGEQWEHIKVPIPEEYMGYFTIAEIPAFKGTEGTLLVNQGPSGDYMGGKVLAKFASKDEGKTWVFTGLVDPDGVLR